jgi:HD-GYP domain-containing protein (c-di-GMP phosphodiesterase class II)
MSTVQRATSGVVKLLVAAVVAAGLGALFLSTRLESVASASPSPSVVGIIVFIAVGLGLELGEHRLALGAATGSIAFIVYIAAAVAFGPVWCAVIAGFSLAMAHLIIGKAPIKILFNVAQNVLALVVGSAVYVLAGARIPPESLDRAAVPFAGLVLTYFLINSGAVSGVVALSERRRFWDVWVRNTWSLAGYDMIASALALGIAWVYLKFGIVGMAAVVVPILFLRHTYLVNLQLQSTNRELLDLMVKAIEARDPYTSGHSQRVAGLARVLARELGLGFKEVEQIETSALLHDVGKIYEEFAPILRKDGQLTSEERKTMQSHPVRSSELVSTISNLRGYVESCVRHHHEHFDGTGYPDGLIGNAIPLGARIVLVADTIDAMTTDRPYRKALGYSDVVRELEDHAGAQFDPMVVAAVRRNVLIRQLVDQESTSERAVRRSAERTVRQVPHSTRQAPASARLVGPRWQRLPD